MNLHPCVTATFPLPTSPAVFVIVQLYVPKSVSAERFNSKMCEFSRILSPVFSFVHNIPATSGFVLVTLQKSVVDPPRLTCEEEAVTSTSGGTIISTTSKIILA